MRRAMTRMKQQLPLRRKWDRIKSARDDLFTTPVLLCLKCRKDGHVAAKCPQDWIYDEFGWTLDQKRRSLEFPEHNGDNVCSRCEKLGLISLLQQDLPWKSREELDDFPLLESKLHRNLGPVDKAVFRKDCPVCVCLFNIIPTPSSAEQEILLFPHWAIARLEGGVHIDTEEKRRSGKCLLAVLQPSFHDEMNLEGRAQRGDSLCILEEDLEEGSGGLGGRHVDPVHLNLDLVNRWISTCGRLHPVTCAPAWSPDLQKIWLVDVFSQEIVQHPDGPCDYVALSYVWGNVKQQGSALGPIDRRIPHTIKDAMRLTKALGKQYLWCDSLCIDQGNVEGKLEQIGMMSSIYRGAWATVIAISGTSANAGLPRVGAKAKNFPQLRCKLNGKRLVGTMPTLSQLIWVSPWGGRAWTLQEALLSPRCLYLSDQQMYFECNSMHCDESINETKSWLYQSLRDDKYLDSIKAVHEDTIGTGVLRTPRETSLRLQHYGVLCNLYSYRTMTNPGDGLNAFAGILQYLEETQYSEGFYWGLPLADLNWALAWQSLGPPERRPMFPSWSWTGWEGGLNSGQPLEVTKPHDFQTYLKVWKIDSGKLVQLFDQAHDMISRDETLTSPSILSDQDQAPTDDDVLQVRETAQSSPNPKTPELPELLDPTMEAVRSAVELSDFHLHLSTIPEPVSSKLLVIEGIVLEFFPDYSRPYKGVCQYSESEWFITTVDDVECEIVMMSTDPQITAPPPDKPHQFLLLARMHDNGCVFLKLLQLAFKGDVAERVTALTLIVPEHRLDVLVNLRPKKKRIAMA